jgi:CheY-like chemotaxis protein
MVESEPGKGTVFRLLFPLIPSRETAERRPEETGTAAQGRETILVAEDDDTLRRLIATMLTEFGYSVIEAVDGEEAVRKFREHGAKVDLAILDVVMPRRGGREVRDEIAKADPDTSVLFISGYGEDILQAKGITQGTANCILKPVSPLDLLRSVRQALDRGGKRRAAGAPAGA